MAEECSGSRFSPRSTKSKTFCSVYGCTSKAARDITVRFHEFPKRDQNFVVKTNIFGELEKIDRRKEWMNVLKMPQRKITKNTVVCSLHFRREDYVLPDVQSQKRYLKSSAVPRCNLPKSTQCSKDSCNSKNTNARDLRKIERGKKKQREEKQRELEENKLAEMDFLPITANECGVVKDIVSEVNAKAFVSIGVQVKTGDFNVQFVDLITTDSELCTLTGIANSHLLQRIIDAVKIVYPENTKKSRLDTRGKVIMTFMKLKHNMSYAILAVLFKCVQKAQCSKIVGSMLTKLSNVLKFAIPFPSKDEISRNLPTCFANFTNVRIILDCTEIFIQRPKKLCCQIATYSHYKGANTVKFMTGVTPAGLISYVSDAYGGRTSDKAIFEQSKLVERLEKNEAIMVDKGFLIDNMCLQHGIKLIRPPFLSTKKQFSRDEALENANIAKARVHIERSNQRLKAFNILGAKMPGGLVGRSKEILTIIAAVVNMSAPILGDDKFQVS